MHERGAEQSFSPGDVVYCLAGERDKPLTVEKATVDSPARSSEIDGLSYHYLIVWDCVDQDPNGEGATITKVPDEMFTRQEVEGLLNSKNISMLGISMGLLLIPSPTIIWPDHSAEQSSTDW